MALFIDKPVTAQSTKTKVVKKVEQATSDDTQRKQDDKTTINIDCVNYDINTGVSIVADSSKS